MRKLLYSIMTGVMVVTMVVGMAPSAAMASSHREAPFISTDPEADNTDLYAFLSPDAPDTVTIVANYIPLEEPAGGPNFANFDDNVLYAINIDNTGDGEEDISYQFRFTTKIGNKGTFLYNTGPITVDGNGNYSNTFNYRQFYSVTRVEGGHSEKLRDKLLATPAKQ